jgi:hypothetical protein
MSWFDTIKAPKKNKRAIERAINDTEDYVSLGHSKGGGHGGHFKFTEKDPNKRHGDKEPHKLNIDSSPANLQNWIKRINNKLREKVYEHVSGNYSKERPLDWEKYIRA